MRQLKITKSITNRESASLDRYLSDIAKTELITADEEAVLARKIREGDQAALEKLTTANLRFVVSVAKQYQNQGLALTDLISEGNAGLIKAAKRFDETRGFKFISYAVWWIRQSIIQAVSDQSRMIRLPLNKIGAINKIRKAQSVLEQELERSPSAAELSERTEISEDQVSLSLSASSWHVSMDAPITEGLNYIDTVKDLDAIQPDSDLMSASLSIEIVRALQTLTSKEQDILVMFYGIGMSHSFTLDEIGDKYDLSRERVRQIKEKAIRRLRHVSKSKLLKDYLG